MSSGISAKKTVPESATEDPTKNISAPHLPFPTLADKVRRPFKIFSLVFFLAIVVGALVANWHIFLKVIGLVALAVLIHNALALNIGYWSGRLFRLPVADTRAVAIEVGIQNSALGLVLVFNFFNGLGGMAIIVAWWGVWHIIAGLFTAFLFTRRALPEPLPQ